MKPMTTQILPNARLTALIAGLALGLVAGLHAQTSDTASSNSSIAHRDRSFLEKAAESGAKEVSLSQLALDHSQDPDVKSFAQTMVTDHTAVNSKLMALASQKGVAVEDYVTKGQKDDYDSLAKENGADFDKDYVKEMVSDHKDAVELFSTEGKKSKDSDLSSFANGTVMQLQHHLDMAESLEKKVNP